jgi:hypothetical protein
VGLNTQRSEKGFTCNQQTQLNQPWSDSEDGGF